MANSDSEEFESADEEIVDKIEKKEKNARSSNNVDSKKAYQQQEPNVMYENKETPLEKEPQSSWRSWGAFGMISSASKTVASITTQVSQSISTAIDSINIPQPEEMAKMQATEEKDTETPKESEESVFKLDSLLSNVTSISSKVVTGSIDTLEGIGKKTINILQETDPNIKSKIRNMNVGNKPNLSELLKEAKDRSDEVSVATANEVAPKTMSFEHLLDENSGLVYLEALELLSEQSKLKIGVLLKPLSGKSLAEMEETLSEIEELCELPDSEVCDGSISPSTLGDKLKKAIEDLNLNNSINFSEIVQSFILLDEWIVEYNENNLEAVYAKSLESLAKLCAFSLHNFQKLAELMLSLSHRSTADEADSITQLTSIYFSLFNLCANSFTKKISSIDSSGGKKISTNIYLEAQTASSYVKTAFNHFIPILQLGAL